MILIDKYSANKNKQSISHHLASLPSMKEALLNETKNRDTYLNFVFTLFTYRFYLLNQLFGKFNSIGVYFLFLIPIHLFVLSSVRI